MLNHESSVNAKQVPLFGCQAIYRMGEEPTPDKVAAIVKLKQFGKLFEKSTILQLPFALGNDFTDLGGVRYAIVRHNVDWNDTSGMWQLVVLQEAVPELP